MKRQVIVLALAVLFLGAAALAQAQTAFKVPFEFKAGGKNLPKGDYTLSKTPEGGLLFKQDASGKETPVAVLERIKPEAPAAEPRLVFDEVGDFAPSYTEYITVYVLSEVWLAGEDGYRIHVTKGAHKTKEVKGEAVKR